MTEPASLLERRPLVWACAGGTVLLTVAAQCVGFAMPDMAFLLYAAGRVLDGARLYHDVVEINPPLIVALNIPVVWLARLTGLSEFLLYRLFTALLVGALLVVCRHLLRLYVLPDSVPRRYLLLALCFVLFPLAAEDFGEREHIVLALLLPYLLVAAARLQGRELRPRDSVGAGLLAGIALALKPHFVLAWLGVETYLRVRNPAVRRRVSPELIAVAAAIGVYALSVVVFSPEYLRLAATLGPLYTIYLRDPFYRLVLLGPGAALVLFSLLCVVAQRRRTSRPKLWGLAAVAVIGCLLAAAAQEKGLRYHFYPSFGLAFVLLAIVAAEARKPEGALSERLYGRVGSLVAVTLVIVVLGRTALDLVGGTPAERRAQAEFEQLVETVRQRAGGEPIGVLSYHIGSAFPLVNYAGVPLASRFPHLWLFPVSYWDELHRPEPLPYRDEARMSAGERYLFSSVREDLTGTRPRVLLVLRPGRDVLQNGLRRLHYIRYFSRDSALGALLGEYQLVAQQSQYDIYERLEPGSERSGPPPSSAPGSGDARLARVAQFRLGILDGELLAGLGLFAGLWIWTAVPRPRRVSSPVR